MSDFVLERNFQRRFDDTSKNILLPVTRLYTPSIMITRILKKTSTSGDNLYEVAAVLVTRQGDQIVLSNGNATDAELKQNEDNRPVVEQQTIFSQEMKKVEQNLHQVVHAREKENAGYRYDAKEKGNGHYEKEERKKKDKKQQKADNVYLKGQTSGFDIKV